VTVPEATLHDAARALLAARVARLVVIEQSRVAGIPSRGWSR
jgi:CBS domain-containing protein